jgi:radical SAM protein with 4Fe4S-binding SPASM domain
LPNWAIKSPTLFKIAAGATGLGCFGYQAHPVFEITSRCNLRRLHCHASGGDVWPCAFTPISGGNLLRDDARDIRYRSPAFSSLKTRDKITGICGKCEYKNVCGGCRARAFSYSGDYLGEDPECALFKQNRRP